MERSPRSAGRVHYGICLNEECPNAKSKKVIELPIRKELLCPDCGKPLRECPPPKKGNKLPIYIGIGVAVAAIAAGGLLLFGGSDETEETTTADVLPADADTLRVAPTDTLQVAPNDTVPAGPTDSVRAGSTGRSDTLVIIIDDKKGNATEAEQTEAERKPATPAGADTESGAHRLSYGSWTGGWRNGQPHGTGTMTYTTSHTIDSRDPKGRVAQAGEYIVGEWYNGHLVQGRWFKKDGTKEAVIIGKAE